MYKLLRWGLWGGASTLVYALACLAIFKGLMCLNYGCVTQGAEWVDVAFFNPWMLYIAPMVAAVVGGRETSDILILFLLTVIQIGVGFVLGILVYGVFKIFRL